MARMPYMSVVAKFPGAQLAFLASREFLFRLCCLHVWSLALWSTASTEPQAKALLLRCPSNRVLPASGDPHHFLYHSVVASSDLSVTYRLTPAPLLPSRL